MGVGRTPSAWVIPLACAVIWTAGACNGGRDKSQGGGIAGHGSKIGPSDGPLTNGPTNKATPGLEPPNNTDMHMPGMTPIGSGGAPAPMSGAAGSGNAMSPPTSAGGASGASGGFAGSAAQAGNGGSGGFMNNPGSPVDGGVDAGSDAGASAACAQPECGLFAPCEDPALHCISLDACDHPVCIAVQAACQAECSKSDCALLESFPEQVSCN